MSVRRKLGLGVACLALASLVAWGASDRAPRETEKLAQILDWNPGRDIGEVGAGHGDMAVEAARRVGPAGHVFATEIDPKRLAAIRKRTTDRRLTNLTVIESGLADCRLPVNCCDAVFMRNVYHHFTSPAEMDTSLKRALRPQGLLAIADFPPIRLLTFFFPVKGVPQNRGGHGIPLTVLIEELTAAGFQHVDTVKDWPGFGYCALFQKPR